MLLIDSKFEVPVAGVYCAKLSKLIMKIQKNNIELKCFIMFIWNVLVLFIQGTRLSEKKTCKFNFHIHLIFKLPLCNKLIPQIIPADS